MILLSCKFLFSNKATSFLQIATDLEELNEEMGSTEDADGVGKAAFTQTQELVDILICTPGRLMDLLQQTQGKKKFSNSGLRDPDCLPSVLF